MLDMLIKHGFNCGILDELIEIVRLQPKEYGNRMSLSKSNSLLDGMLGIYATLLAHDEMFNDEWLRIFGIWK